MDLAKIASMLAPAHQIQFWFLHLPPLLLLPPPTPASATHSYRHLLLPPPPTPAATHHPHRLMCHPHRLTCHQPACLLSSSVGRSHDPSARRRRSNSSARRWCIDHTPMNPALDGGTPTTTPVPRPRRWHPDRAAPPQCRHHLSGKVLDCLCEIDLKSTALCNWA
jgi:hypothetical protein